MADTSNSLRVRDLSMTSDRGRPILEVPAFDLSGGNALGVRGPSGAGKSSFLFALAGLAERTTGQVIWGGKDILSLGDGAQAEFRRTRVGMVFQDFLLFEELDAPDNASLLSLFASKAERESVRARSDALLGAFGVPVGERSIATFSGGEKQRVAVARALSHDPDIILADEPTASLDGPTADALTEDLLRHVRERGATFVVVSHDETLLGKMDRVIALEHGRCVNVPEKT